MKKYLIVFSLLMVASSISAYGRENEAFISLKNIEKDLGKFEGRVGFYGVATLDKSSLDNLEKIKSTLSDLAWEIEGDVSRTKGGSGMDEEFYPRAQALALQLKDRIRLLQQTITQIKSKAIGADS